MSDRSGLRATTQLRISMASTADPVSKGATFSPCRTYRYTLERRWGDGPACMFIGLNPSTADETTDDPTVRRCIRYARDWGYDALWMTNLFAYRATDPKVMLSADDPIGPDNDSTLRELASRAGVVVAAWSNYGTHLDRARHVQRLIGSFGVLGLTKDGHPRHPLYMRKTCVPLNPLTLETL